MNQDPERAALETIIAILFRQVRTVTAEANATRIMLERLTVIDPAEHRGLVDELLQTFDAQTEQIFRTAAREAADTDAALTLLRNFRGIPQ